MDGRGGDARGVWISGWATLFAVGVSGFHPFVEDGGVYAAGVRKLIDPALYPAWTAFVTEHLRFSVFAPMVAGAVRVSHLRLEWMLLILFVASTWATLLGAWMLAARLTANDAARRGAVALLACWLTLPIAGTSLMLMDPYVTARSFTLPLTLLALAWALDGTRGGWLKCGLALAAGATLHPLMAGYGAAAAVMLACLRAKLSVVRRGGSFVLLTVALLGAWLVERQARPESLDYVRVALTRYYWFPLQWHWYEWLGLVAPLLILQGLATPARSAAWRAVAQAGIQLGLIAILVGLLFCREGTPTHLVARLQPLRIFQVVYALMIVLLGAWFGERVLRTVVWRWGVMLAVLGGVMFWAQRATFAHSAHIEWPGAQAVNPWQQAFVWVRENTPKDALFALDSRYITRGRAEDAQCFRAIAERSALADYSKDGGEASITPDLTEAWIDGQSAQTALETESDSERVAKLRPLGVTWVVLETSSATGWECDYRNATVKICRVPQLSQ